MFIDDLADSFQDYEKLKPARLRLKRRQEAAMKKINQDVFIRDLVLRNPYPYCYGEAKSHTNQYSAEAADRLCAHVSFLFKLTNADHRANNCEKDEEGQYHLKKGHENHITRLSMCEFSLYTATPLSTETFQSILSNIEKMAEALEPNTHVLLSSFSILDKNNTLINMCLFVEGGKPPNLHVFAKNTASNVDIDYSQTNAVFSQQQRGSNVSFHADIIASSRGSISTGSVFEIKTEGGACYTQMIDICIDHISGHSKDQMTKRISEKAAPDEIIPNQLEQCITSNSVKLSDNSTLSTNALHADRLLSPHMDYHRPLGIKTLTENEKKQLIPSGYDEMSLVDQPTGYTIINPAFGSDCIIEVLAERPAGNYKPALQSSIQEHNEKVLDRQLIAAKQLTLNKADKLVQHLSRSDILSNSIKELETNMLKKCRPSLWQRLFKTEEYRIKLEAKKIITVSFELMRESICKYGHASLFIVRAWKKDLLFRLNNLGSSPTGSPVQKALATDIRQAIDEKLQSELGVEFEQKEADNPAAPSPKI